MNIQRSFARAVKQREMREIFIAEKERARDERGRFAPEGGGAGGGGAGAESGGQGRSEVSSAGDAAQSSMEQRGLSVERTQETETRSPVDEFEEIEHEDGSVETVEVDEEYEVAKETVTGSHPEHGDVVQMDILPGETRVWEVGPGDNLQKEGVVQTDDSAALDQAVEERTSWIDD